MYNMIENLGLVSWGGTYWKKTCLIISLSSSLLQVDMIDFTEESLEWQE